MRSLIDLLPVCRYGVRRWGGMLAAVLLVMPAVALAGPPFFTDDPEPVEFHHGELYLASMYQLSKDGSSATAPHVEANYGAARDLQIHLIAPMALEAPHDGPTEYGYGDTELGVKYRFLQESDYVPMAGVFPLVELPTGDEDRGLGNGRMQVFLPVWLQKSFDQKKWTTYGGGGYWFNNAKGAKDHWFFGWELQRQITDHIALGGEIFHQTSDAEGANPHTGFNLGTIIDLSEHHHILFSAGRDILGDNRFTSYVGYQFTF